MNILFYIIISFLILYIPFSLWLIWRLNLYIQKLEKKIESILNKQDNLSNSLKEALKQDLLEDNGNLKKLLVSKEDM